MDVTTTWEAWSEERKRNFCLTEWRDPDATRLGSVGTLLGDTFALHSCGVGNVPWTLGSTHVYFTIGLGRVLFRLARLTWVKNVPKLRAHWQSLADMPNLRCIVFFHGEPIVGSGTDVRRAVTEISHGI